VSSTENELYKEIEEGLGALTVRNVPTLRAFRRTISRQIAKWAPWDVLSLAERLCQRDLNAYCLSAHDKQEPRCHVDGGG
jgi:hypothetical protein